MKPLTKLIILEAISDHKSQELFGMIANDNEPDLLVSSKMSRKEYYTRISKLLKADLIKRFHKRYVLTTFGEVIYETQLRLAVAVNNRWKLKALDSLYVNDTISVSERSRTMDKIINDTGRIEITRNIGVQIKNRSIVIQAS